MSERSGLVADPIAAGIVKTIAYFDLFDYPLTPLEVWRWLYAPGQSCGLDQILVLLKRLTEAGVISEHHGMYMLPNREALVATRHSRYILAEHKIAIARRALRVLRWVPFLDMVAVCNNLGYSNTRAEGDIDVLIVAGRGRLWFTRFWVVALTSAMGIRCHGDHITNRVCLSFYVTDEHLELADIAQHPDDPYLRYFIATLLPVYQRAGSDVYDRFIAANTWTLADLPNFFASRVSDRRTVSGTGVVERWQAWSRRIFRGSMGERIEGSCRKLEGWKLRRHDRQTPLTADAHVVITDSMFKRHEQDRRPRYRAAWHERLAQLGL
jgi:hypothetical protein